jgi:hypothetical protein
MAATTRRREARRRTDHRGLHVVSYSNGGALALYALDAPRTATGVRGRIVLLS